jgi:hypothetical protein
MTVSEILVKALLGFIALGLALLVGWYLIERRDILVEHAPQAFYLLLICLGVAVAFLLFGALRSYAKLSGTQLGYTFELGGPAVILILIILGGFRFADPARDLSLTVFLRGDSLAGEKIKEAEVWTDIGDRRDPRPVSFHGEVVFKGIPSHHRSADYFFGLRSNHYQLKYPGKTYKIPDDRKIYLDVIPTREGPFKEPETGRLLLASFKPIYDLTPDLRIVRAPARLSSDAYQAKYEHAHVVWIRELQTIFVLPDDPAKKMIRYQETSYATDQDLFDEARARQIFKTPNDKKPPHGGIANLWRKDPDKWSWMGWREWHCRFFDQVSFQQFDGGMAVGILRLTPDQDQGQLLALLDNGTFRSASTDPSDQVPKCGEVGPQFPQRKQL